MSNARTLVVDDKLTNLKLISDILEYENYEILKRSTPRRHNESSGITGRS
jgi:CheY-like chemotaxis protein